MDFGLDLDLLYWQPQEDGVPFAVASEVKNPEMKWGPGWRIGFDFGLPRDQWSVYLVWTSIPIQKDTVAEGHLFPVWSSKPQVEGDFVTHAKAHWRLHLGIVDLDLRKAWELSPSFTLLPHLGIRFASLRQKYYVTYEGGSLFPDQVDNFNSKNKFWGLGPETGLNASWGLGKGWSLFSEMGMALVWGHFYIHESEKEHVTHTNFLKLFDIFDVNRALFDMAIGLEYEWKHLSLHAAWEQHYFPRQNQLIFQTPQLLSNHADLSIVGITVGGKYDF